MRRRLLFIVLATCLCLLALAGWTVDAARWLLAGGPLRGAAPATA